ncbi:hypothetical protein [Labrys wisconsinensis]|uniref:Lipoprotein n=1 Tax=Labrys wisconsinensis TaxID=425677 RepID=A0ABU0JJQ0_9HYPH|nr:hypothetical protein [Labrys wisconsinensis]MDQ0474517.1 hypothetical protein [Labrys wisconsinensis]
MKSRHAAAVALAALLAGCAGESRPAIAYDTVAHGTIATPGGTFWIWDRPDLGRLKTAPAPGTVAGRGFLRKLMLAAEGDPALAAHRAAAYLWFARTDRLCEVRSTEPLKGGAYEQAYECRPRASPADAPAQ